ncbi:unnamed protein product [Allacma fusca]|uniref:Chitin-binding type-2 domain-containing protein n=1 Tax=Allacma fusca TaxID=39272 RepID=A0A8J2K637_9HEXA|nr:unnamed protein product [Allacma fusca]
MYIIKVFLSTILIFNPAHSNNLGNTQQASYKETSLCGTFQSFQYKSWKKVETRFKRQHDSVLSFLSLKLRNRLSNEAAGKLKEVVKRNVPRQRGKRQIPRDWGELDNGNSLYSRFESTVHHQTQTTNGFSTFAEYHYAENVGQNFPTIMGMFHQVNQNFDMAQKFVNFPEIRCDPFLSKSMVINPRGVTCADACEPEPENVFGTIGICTATYCTCNSAQGNQPQTCEANQVFDPSTFSCADPSQTVLCSD